MRRAEADGHVDGQFRDIALVDVAVYDDLFLGSRAIWDITKVSQIVVSRCRPDSIGLSTVAGQLMSISPEEPRGLALDLDPDFACRVRAAIGPGLFADVGVSRVRQLLPGDDVPVGLTPCVLALDGEREVEVRRGQRASIRLSEDTMMGLSLTFDHRVEDGAPAAEFLKALVEYLAEPALLLF